MPLSPTLMFEHPTPRAIAAHLLEQVREQVQPSMAVLSGRQLQSAGHDRVVLGDVAARWPGGCCTEAALQMMAHSSGDAVSTVPAQRWTLEATVDVGVLSVWSVRTSMCWPSRESRAAQPSSQRSHQV